MELPIILDVEASGFGRDSYPIEVGFANREGDTHCYLIHPEPDWNHWDTSSEQLHGINRELLIQRGRPVQEIGQQLNQLMAGKTIYSDGWGFDQTWLSLLFDRAQLVPQFKLETLMVLLNEAQLAIWDSTKQEVLAELGFQRHRASNDALLLQQTYARTLTLV